MKGKAEWKKRIDKHLRRVRRNLKHLPPRERDEVLRAVEEHINEELAARVRGEPTREDVETVLAGMDPPESYSRTPAVEDSPERKKDALGWAALFTAIVGAVALGLAFALGALIGGGTGELFLVIAGALGLIASILGAFSFSTTNGKIAVAAGALIFLAALILLPVRRVTGSAPVGNEVTRDAARRFGNDRPDGWKPNG